MHIRSLAALAASLMLATPAFAADPARVSKDMYALFSDACVGSLAIPDGVKAWAASHHLQSVTDAQALQAFAGGDSGSVWEAKMPSAAFALALRAQGGACAVYGDKVDVSVVEDQFHSLLDALKSSGRTLTLVKEDKTPSDYGLRHGLVYVASGSPSIMLVAMITDEKPGGLFQATIQISERVSGPGSSTRSGG